MATERLELPDGQWAEQRTSPLHEQYVRIMAAQEAAMLGRGSFEEVGDVKGRELTIAWHVRGEDGKLLDLDDEGWALLPADVSIPICQKANELWERWQQARRPKATSRPNGSAGRKKRTSASSSADTSPASPST